MTEIDDAWKALNKNGFALDYDEDSRPGALAKAIDYALAAKDDEIGQRDERISELEAQIEGARRAAFEEVMTALDLMRSRAATNFTDANCQGQRGQDRCDALYDAYHIVRKLALPSTDENSRGDK